MHQTPAAGEIQTHTSHVSSDCTHKQSHILNNVLMIHYMTSDLCMKGSSGSVTGGYSATSSTFSPGLYLQLTAHRTVAILMDQLHVLPLLGTTVHHKPTLLKLEGQDQDQSHHLEQISVRTHIMIGTYTPLHQLHWAYTAYWCLEWDHAVVMVTGVSEELTVQILPMALLLHLLVFVDLYSCKTILEFINLSFHFYLFSFIPPSLLVGG